MRDGRGGHVRGSLRRVRAAAALGLAVLAASGVLLPSTATEASGAPQIRHVWVVVLENEGYNSAFVNNPNTYLSKTLPSKGALIPNYYGIAHQSLPNYIAMLSGQSPTTDTQADCPNYIDVNAGKVGSSPNQAIGNGCVYPPQYITLADQLASIGLRWKGYMEDLRKTAGRDDNLTCNPKAAQNPGTADSTQSAATDSGNDQYATRHNPFMYFHSIIDQTDTCNANVVTLQSANNGLYQDLKTISTTPNFSFVVPNLCNDGHDGPNQGVGGCYGKDVSGDSTGGLTAIDHWLSMYVPLITGSPAYQQDGMLAVVFDEASTSEGASCCNQQSGPNATYGNGPPDPNGNGYGGGQVGAVVLSPFIKPGTMVPKNANGGYNHYSLLKTLENLFHTTGGDDNHGHLGYASDNMGLSPWDPGAMGADVFTNPGYVPPPPPAPGVLYLPPPPPLFTPPPPVAAPTPAHSGAPIAGPLTTTVLAPTATAAAATPSPTPAHWDRSMLMALPGDSGNAGLIAGFVLAPLLATGAVTFFLRKRGSA